MGSLSKIHSFFKQGTAILILLVVTITATAGQFYVLRHLPFIDCLPYKKGNNIVQQMKTPEGAIPDSFAILFTYKKAGKEISFDQDHFPADFDSTYEYENRADKLVKKGNGLQAKIADFSLHGQGGADTTAAIFAQKGKYILILAKEIKHTDDWNPQLVKTIQAAKEKQIPVILVTADVEKARSLFGNLTIITCDATVLKTAARVNPTFCLMQEATILEKFSYADADALIRIINGQ